jgi:nucleoporin NUP82
VPVYYQIRQLIISPSGVFLAICTEHTVHIAVLPDPSRLKDQDQSPLKLKTYQLGPTTHVIPESPIVSALWHPLAVASNSADCLVTVTAEAAVRVWEIDRSNLWSFERPALAIDLKKLADGVSCDEDFEPSGFGKSRGFSVDNFDMEASAACFGGHGEAEEDPWASMTLWTAMRNGGVYALCPLIPSKWAPTVTTIPSLSTRAVLKAAAISNPDTDPEEERAASQQYEWVQEIDSEEQLMTMSGPCGEEFEVRRRPTNPSATPRLQGPFEIQLGDDFADLEVSDIYVISARLAEDELFSGEDDYANSEAESIGGLPYSLICLVTTDGQLCICMDLEGVSGQWLPKKKRNAFTVPDSDAKELELVEIFNPEDSDLPSAESHWPIFTNDPASPYNFFLTTGKQVYSVSLADWCSRIGPELFPSGEGDPGLQTRLVAACQDQVCDAEELISTRGESSSADGGLLSAPVIFDDPALGSMLLTSTPSKAYAVSFDQQHALLLEDGANELDLQSLVLSPLPSDNTTNATPPTRPTYEVPDIFLRSSTAPLKNFLTSNLPSSRQQALKQPIKLSPATLEIMTSTHRILSSQTSQLEKAAAELFRRCERMRSELNEQVKQMAELADRLQHISGEGGDSADANGRLEDRIAKAQERQKKLVQKYEVLRRKTGRVSSSASRELSTKEVAWASEVQDLSKTFGLDDADVVDDNNTRGISGRFQMVRFQCCLKTEC